MSATRGAHQYEDPPDHDPDGPVTPERERAALAHTMDAINSMADAMVALDDEFDSDRAYWLEIFNIQRPRGGAALLIQAAIALASELIDLGILHDEECERRASGPFDDAPVLLPLRTRAAGTAA